MNKTFLFLLMMVFLVACAQEEESVATPETTVVATASPTARPESTRPAAATATPSPLPPATPTPLLPAISLTDQSLGDDGQLLVGQVIAAERGWLVIHPADDDQEEQILGYIPVEAGLNENLVVVIDPFQAVPELEATLHLDQGEAGVFEYPGPDTPVRQGETAVAALFNIAIEMTLPAVIIADQTGDETGTVLIDQVVATEPGWLAIHSDENGQPGQVVGFVPVEAGEWSDVTIRINWRRATPDLHVVLYRDTGTLTRFEYPEEDPPVQINGIPISAPFRAIFPPDIFVLNQPVFEQSVVIERAVSYGPGWLVIYLDDNGSTGNIIGWAPLEDGVNEQITVELLNAGYTTQMHILLHEDNDDLGQFEFPRSDPAVVYDGRLPDPVTFQTDTGNYLIARDQQLGPDNTITIPLIVTDVDTWVIIRAGSGDESSPIIGRTWMPAGLHRNVLVEVDPEQVTRILTVILHLDAGVSQSFDFPGGLDIPLQRNRSVIQVPFIISAG